MNLTSLFDIGKSALSTAQRRTMVTGHNIANVNTPGYSRQEAILQENRPLNDRPGQVGSGVQVAEIRQQVDRVVEDSLRRSSSALGTYDAARSWLLRVQDSLGTSGEQGLGATINEFFQAWQDVSTNPADLTARTVLLSRANTLALQFNRTANDLDRQRQGIDTEIGQTITDINGLAAKIAGLNQEISLAESRGQQANDLRDQRRQLLGALSTEIGISTIEDSTGQVTVFVGKGHLLVDRERAYQLAGVADAGNSGLQDVRYIGSSGSSVDLTSLIGEGRLKGLLDVRDQHIPAAQGSLDTLAASMVARINQQHRAGFGLDGSTGQDFFATAGVTARTLAVALTDGRAVAASSTAAGIPGNNTNAVAIAGLQSQAVAFLSGQTFNQYFNSTVTTVGTQAQAAQRNVAAQEIVHEHLEARRAEISGVSIDEELVQMIQSQRAFQAASRVITVADEMLQTLLTLKR
jgi:flagellar hook-associated protein 1 FlgK